MNARNAMVALLLLPGAAAAQDEPLDPQAMEIMQASAEFLAAQKDLSFNWFFTFDDVVDGREKITSVRSGETAMRRGEGFVSLSERGDGLRDYYYDGKTFTVAVPDQNYYASGPFDGGYEALAEAVKAHGGVIVPLWGMLSAKLPEEILDGVEKAAYVGEVLVAGRVAHHLAFSEYDLDWQIWISAEDGAPLPMMIVATRPYVQGWPQYTLFMNDWNLSPDIAEGAFTFVPDEDDALISFSSLAPSDDQDTATSGEDAK